MDELLAMFNSFAEALDEMTPVLQHMTADFMALSSSVATFAASLATSLAVATGGISAVVGVVTTGLQMLADAAITTGKKLLSALVNPLAALAQGFQFAAGPTAMMASSMTSAINGMTTAIIGPFQQLANAVGPFVEALNPGLMRLFHVALRDLMATFGVAFTPVIQHVIAVFNKLSSALTPLMRMLAPIVDDLMSRVEGVLVPMVGIIAENFRAMAPFIKVVTGAIADAVEALRAVFAVLQGAMSVLFDELRKALGISDLKDFSAQLRDLIHDLVKLFAMFAASVAKSFGVLDPFINAVLKNLRSLEGATPGTKAAPQNFRMSGLEQISKDLALAAFSAQGMGGTRVRSEAESLEDLVSMVRGLADENLNLDELLEQKLEEFREKAEKFVESNWQKVEKWWEEVGAKRLSDEIERIVRDAAGKLLAPAAAPAVGFARGFFGGGAFNI